MSPPRGNFEKLFQDLYLKMLELVRIQNFIDFLAILFCSNKTGYLFKLDACSLSNHTVV